MQFFPNVSAQYKYVPNTFSVGAAAAVQIAPPNPNRVAILITDSSGGQLSISFDSGKTGTNAPFFTALGGSMQPILWRYEDVGPLIQAAIFANRTVSGLSTVGVVEVIYAPSS